MPGDMPIEVAARVNAMSNGVSWAVTIPGTSMGDTAVVLGCGQRGLSALIALKEAGARTVAIAALSGEAGARAIGISIVPD